MATIAFVTKAWRSGAAWYAQMLVQAIADQGVHVAFVAPLAEPPAREPSHPNVARVTTSREMIGPEPRLFRVFASLRRVVGGLMAIARVRRTTRTFIFSIPEPLVFTIPVFALLRLTGAIIIFVVHDAEPHAWRFGKALHWVEREAHRLSCHLASHLVALTRSTAQQLTDRFGVPSAKVSVIPHGPFLVANVSPIPGQRRLLVFGSLRRNKCVLEVIRAVILVRREDPAVVLVIAGEPLREEPGYWDECRAAISADPAGFDVRVGFVPDDQLPQLLSVVDGFILAYRGFSSQSGVGIMAALSGRPVIGSTSGGLEELYARGMTGEIIGEPLTIESIAAAILRFVAAPAEEWRTRASIAANTVGTSLSWSAIARDYIALAQSGEPPAG